MIEIYYPSPVFPAQVLVSTEVRLQYFTAVEHLLINVVRQGGDPNRSALRLIRSAPEGEDTAALLSNIIDESSTNLLFTSRQRAVLSPKQRLSGSSVEPVTREVSPVSQSPRPSSVQTLHPEVMPPPSVGGDFVSIRGRVFHHWGGSAGGRHGRGIRGPSRGRRRRHVGGMGGFHP